MTTATAPTALTTARPRPALAVFQVDDTPRGRRNATAFGVLTFFGLSFALALVLPGSALVAGEVAALVLAVVAVGRLVGARDAQAWLRAASWVIAAVLGTGIAIAAVFTFLVSGAVGP